MGLSKVEKIAEDKKKLVVTYDKNMEFHIKFDSVEASKAWKDLFLEYRPDLRDKQAAKQMGEHTLSNSY